jgi:hypothetical protein
MSKAENKLASSEEEETSSMISPVVRTPVEPSFLQKNLNVISTDDITDTNQV